MGGWMMHTILQEKYPYYRTGTNNQKLLSTRQMLHESFHLKMLRNILYQRWNILECIFIIGVLLSLNVWQTLYDKGVGNLSSCFQQVEVVQVDFSAKGGRSR